MRASSPRSGARLAKYAGAVAGAAAVGGWATRRSLKGWYATLRKPPYQPPDAAFGPVWTVLYFLMAWSAWRVARAPRSPARSRALRLWWTQLALNAAWSPLFFGLRRPRAALVDTAALAGAIAAYIGAARRVDPAAAGMMAPYAAWVGYASFLNGEIVRRNPRSRG